MDKLKKWGNYGYGIFMSVVFGDGGETHNEGRVGLLMGKMGSYLPSTNFEKVGVFWLHCTA